MHRVFVGVLLFSCAAFAQTDSKFGVDDVVREAQVSNALSDRYKSFRLSSFLKDKRPEAFLKQGVDEYLEAMQRLTSDATFSTDCNRLSKVKAQDIRDRILYTCGRLLFDDYALKQSEDLMLQISEKSSYYIPAQILLGTIALSNSDGQKCTRVLHTKLAKLIKNQQTADMYHLTRARCFVEVNMVDKAILEYQFIGTSSLYYFDALEETAWSQFRSRHLESARTLLDVMVTSYESGFGDKKNVTSGTYFRSRYLQAYIELIERNTKRAESLFKSLHDAIEKFEKESVISEKQSVALANLIYNKNLSWIDMKAMPKEVTSFLDMVKEWGDVRFRKRLERLIDYQFSLSREIKRLTDDPKPEFESYLNDMLSLDSKNKALLESEFAKSAKGVARAIRVMRIKSDLGRIEIVWSDRAQGMRGIGELLESYQYEVDEVEDFLGQ